MNTLLMLIIFILICTDHSLAFQPVDVNSADVKQLALLPGIGKRLSENIIAYRIRHGRFKQLEDLAKIPSMTTKKLEHLKDRIVFNKPSRPARAENEEPKRPLSIKPIIDLRILEERVLLAQHLLTQDDSSLAQRVRRAAWLPKLSASFDVDHADVETLRKAERTNDSFLTRAGGNYGFGIKAIFDLDKLMYNSEELEVAKLSLKRQERRDELIAKLHKNYFRYAELARTPIRLSDAEIRAKLEQELAEVRAYLDSISQGAFSNFSMD